MPCRVHGYKNVRLYADWTYLANGFSLCVLAANHRNTESTKLERDAWRRERKTPKNETAPTYANSLLSINKIVVVSVRHVEACMYCTTVFYIYLIADRFASSCYFFLISFLIYFYSFRFSFRRCLFLITIAPLRKPKSYLLCIHYTSYHNIVKLK